MSTTARRVLALLPLLLAVPSLAAAQLDSCDAAAVTARVDGTLSSGGSTIAFSGHRTDPEIALEAGHDGRTLMRADVTLRPRAS